MKCFMFFLLLLFSLACNTDTSNEAQETTTQTENALEGLVSPDLSKMVELPEILYVYSADSVFLDKQSITLKQLEPELEKMLQLQPEGLRYKMAVKVAKTTRTEVLVAVLDIFQQRRIQAVLLTLD